MPEPFTLLALGCAKLAGMHAAHLAAAQTAASVTGGAAAGATSAHIAAYLIAGVAAGTVLYAICNCLKRLVEAGIFSKRQAEAYKSKAESSDEKIQKEMLRDAEALCEKWAV